MPFEWHAKKAESNLEKHGVSFDEAATVSEISKTHFFEDGCRNEFSG